MLHLFRSVLWMVVHQCYTLVKGVDCGSEHRPEKKDRLKETMNVQVICRH